MTNEALAEAVWGVAILTSVVHATFQHSDDLDRRVVYLSTVISLAGAFIGSVCWGFYDYGLPNGLFNPLLRGKSFLGGLVGGMASAVIFLRCRGVSVNRYGDVLATALALGYAIGRVGCFFNGCDYGVLTRMSWGHSYPPGTEAYAGHLARRWITPEAATSLPVLPVQLLASACGLGIFAILVARKPPWPGANLCLFSMMYGLYRFCIEFLRGDFRTLVLGLSLPQVVSIVLMAGGCATWMGRARACSSSAPPLKRRSGDETTHAVSEAASLGGRDPSASDLSTAAAAKADNSMPLSSSSCLP